MYNISTTLEWYEEQICSEQTPSHDTNSVEGMWNVKLLIFSPPETNDFASAFDSYQNDFSIRSSAWENQNWKKPACVEIKKF